MSMRFPFPYDPAAIFSIVDGTVQAVIAVDPADPEGGTFDLIDDPEDAQVQVFARISPNTVPAPVTPEGEEDEEAVPEDVDEEWEEDEDLTDADDDEAVEDDPDAPEDPDD